MSLLTSGPISACKVQVHVHVHIFATKGWVNVSDMHNTEVDLESTTETKGQKEE